ncbi:hypothetical protein FRAHR75_90041 [Frankia sp. Hr75.2]|nr:hypothetical protein FRAHR75_90041 [Frankia sp. Hr75.2]
MDTGSEACYLTGALTRPTVRRENDGATAIRFVCIPLSFLSLDGRVFYCVRMILMLPGLRRWWARRLPLRGQPIPK